MEKYIQVNKNSYFDSVTLMSLTAELKKIPEVKDIMVAMATAMNKELIDRIGLANEETESAGENDLIIAFYCDGITPEDIVGLIENKLKGQDEEEKKR